MKNLIGYLRVYVFVFVLIFSALSLVIFGAIKVDLRQGYNYINDQHGIMMVYVKYGHRWLIYPVAYSLFAASLVVLYLRKTGGRHFLDSRRDLRGIEREIEIELFSR